MDSGAGLDVVAKVEILSSREPNPGPPANIVDNIYWLHTFLETYETETFSGLLSFHNKEWSTGKAPVCGHCVRLIAVRLAVSARVQLTSEVQNEFILTHVGHWTAGNNELIIAFPRCCCYFWTREQFVGFVLWKLSMWARFRSFYSCVNPQAIDRKGHARLLWTQWLLCLGWKTPKSCCRIQSWDVLISAKPRCTADGRSTVQVFSDYCLHRKNFNEHRGQAIALLLIRDVLGSNLDRLSWLIY